MKTLPDSPLTIWLDDCADGWISLHLRSGEAELRLSCTHWDDPFPGIVRWAKRLLAGSPREGARINQEGWNGFLIAETAAPAGTVQLSVHEAPDGSSSLPPPRLRWHGPREALAATVYRAIHDFAASAAYDPRQWAYMSFAAWLVYSDTNGRPLSEITTQLLATPRKRLLRMLNAGCPYYCYPEWGSMIPCAWNRSSIEMRRPILQALLRRLPGSWDACDLPLLRCRTLEILCYGALRPLPYRLRRLRS